MSHIDSINNSLDNVISFPIRLRSSFKFSRNYLFRKLESNNFNYDLLYSNLKRYGDYNSKELSLLKFHLEKYPRFINLIFPYDNSYDLRDYIEYLDIGSHNISSFIDYIINSVDYNLFDLFVNRHPASFSSNFSYFLLNSNLALLSIYYYPVIFESYPVHTSIFLKFLENCDSSYVPPIFGILKEYSDDVYSKLFSMDYPFYVRSYLYDLVISSDRLFSIYSNEIYSHLYNTNGQEFEYIYQKLVLSKRPVSLESSLKVFQHSSNDELLVLASYDLFNYSDIVDIVHDLYLSSNPLSSSYLYIWLLVAGYNNNLFFEYSFWRDARSDTDLLIYNIFDKIDLFRLDSNRLYEFKKMMDEYYLWLIELQPEYKNVYSDLLELFERTKTL